MKIHDKLILSFLGTSLLVGMVGYIATLTNRSIKNEIIQITQSSINELKISDQMLAELQDLHIATQDLVAERNVEETIEDDGVSDRQQQSQLEARIEKEISDFEKKLVKAKRTTELAHRTQVDSDKPQTAQDLKQLRQLELEFLLHKKLIAQYLAIEEGQTDTAEKFLEDTLETHFQESLLPLVQRYNVNAALELESAFQEIRSTLQTGNRLVVTSTFITLLISVVLGCFISYSLSKPIIQLRNAAEKISQGYLDERVDIPTKDEVGVLARVFNRMMDSLSDTTVSKTYVDNIIDSMVDTLIVVEPDKTIKKVNQAALKLLGYQEDELVGQSVEMIFLPEHELPINELMEKDFIESVEESYLTKSGIEIPISFSASVMRDHKGEIQGIVCVGQDITERKHAEEALRESQERYELAARAVNDGLWDWNLRTNEVYFSSRWKAMLGFEEDEIDSSPNEWFSRVHAEDIERLKLELSSHLEGLTTCFEIEYIALHKDGTHHWMHSRGVAARDQDGKAYRIAGSQTDITERKIAEEQLFYDAFHDVLTGLPNRALFRDRLNHVVELAKRRDAYLFAVLFLDLDRFKVINDSLGHLVGDKLLIAIANRLKICLRTGDTVARLGGDEFAILLEDIKDPSDATQIADRIHQELLSPFNLDGQEVFTTVSVGIALSSTGYDRTEDLLRDADTAMYRAKSAGRARYQVFDKTMHVRAVTLLQLENDLRRAIERQEFRIHYQPIMMLSSGRLSGFEALIRWQHPEYGMISPAEFIPVAEETGMIVPIGHWVLREACRQMQVWKESFQPKAPLSISVNLSGKQFSQPDLLDQIETILQETRLDPHHLRLEITESVILENADSASEVLQQLRNLGIRLSIDDFGTGYSSLSYLHRLPVDTLKIDRSFINCIDVDGEKLELVRTIVTLAWNLGMDIVAEGVETPKQLAQLKALKCEAGQGYLFSKPVDGDTAATLIAAALQ